MRKKLGSDKVLIADDPIRTHFDFYNKSKYIEELKIKKEYRAS